MTVAITLDKNTLTINDKTYKAQKCRPGSCEGCAFSLPEGCELVINDLRAKLQSCWCTSMERSDGQSIIWKEA